MNQKTLKIIDRVKKANESGEFYFSYTPCGTNEEVEFQARIRNDRYTAYGTYDSIEEYAVVRGPTQNDVDIISVLLDEAWEPAAEA